MTRNDYYTPRYNGTQGLVEFGEDDNAGEEGTGFSYSTPVDVDGVRVIGPTYEPALVADYFRKGGKVTKGPTKWAHGALRFSKGWDRKASTANARKSVYVDKFGEYHEHVGHCGRTGIPKSEDE